MTDFTKTIQSTRDVVREDGTEAIRVTFTDQSVIVWSVENERQASEIQALVGETISFTDEDELLPEYWVPHRIQ
jgi:hypothetical protein